MTRKARLETLQSAYVAAIRIEEIMSIASDGVLCRAAAILEQLQTSFASRKENKSRSSAARRITRFKAGYRAYGVALSFATLALAASSSMGQKVTAVPKLDFNQFTGSWYEIARLPIKREKICTSDVVEVIALGDRSKQLQIITSCRTNKGYTEVRNATAETQKKRGDGELKVTYFWPFSEKQWVLGMGPGAQWILIGSPNHKELWVFSRTATLSPLVLSEIEQRATAEGFATAKLVTTLQSGR